MHLGRVSLWVSFGLLLSGSMFGFVGCDGSANRLQNAGPSIMVVAARPDPGQSEGLVALDLYVRDLERDPVDLSVSLWRASGAREDALVLASPGHGTRGLSSESRVPGAWHRLYVDLGEVPSDEEVFLEIESVDSNGAPGLTTATDVFKPAIGWSL